MTTVELQRVDPEEHREDVIRLLFEHLTRRSNGERYDWFYRDNPHGSAQMWIARAGADGRIVGSAAVVPRRMRLHEQEVTAGVMADFWIHPDYRFLGPAVRLQRACIDGARELGMPFFFDLPQGSMPAVYKRLRIPPAAELLSHARPLRVDPYLAKAPLPPLLMRPLCLAGNLLMRLADIGLPSRGGLVVAEEQADFGDEFTRLADRVGKDYPTCVSRTAEYLDWRYRRHYHLRHYVVTARIDGELQAYAVFSLDADRAQIVDLFGVTDPMLRRPLIAAVVRAALNRGASALNVPLLEQGTLDPMSKYLKSMWFRQGLSSPVIVQPLSEAAPKYVERFYFAYGDLDY